MKFYKNFRNTINLVLTLSIILALIIKLKDILFINNSLIKLEINKTTLIIIILLFIVIMIYRAKRLKDIVAKKMYRTNAYGFFSKNTLNERIKKTKQCKIVVIGGGTGLSVLLRGIKKYTSDITAIVTVADDGGGSGKLREEMDILSPGDIRNCLLALANTESTMKKVLEHRFEEGSLKNQSFGNLFLVAMGEIYGDFNTGIKEMSNVLAVTGKVLPMTTEDVVLSAELKDGTIVRGESMIPRKSKELGVGIERVFLSSENTKPLDEALEELKQADCIVFGPGSLYTSILPNLLIKDIVKGVKESNASKIYIANIMTQIGETEGYSLRDHIEALLKHSDENIIDYVITNVEKLSEENKEKLKKEGIEQILVSKEDEEWIKEKNITLIKDDYLKELPEIIEHNTDSLSRMIMKICVENKEKKDAR